MAIFIETKDPKKLLMLIHTQIDNDNIKFWSCDSDGDITSLREDLVGKAWLHPYLLEGFLAFGILGRKQVPLSIMTYSAYHAEFLKTLLSQLGGYIPTIIVKAPFENALDTKNIENNNNYEW